MPELDELDRSATTARFSEGIVFSQKFKLFVVLFAANIFSVHCDLNFWSYEMQNDPRK